MRGSLDIFWKRYGGRFLQAVYALAVVCCFPAFLKLGGTVAFTYSGFSVILYALVVWSLARFWERFRKGRRIEKAGLCLLSFAFLLCMAWGRMLDDKGYLDMRDIRGWAAPVLTAPYAAMLLYKIYADMEAVLCVRRAQTALDAAPASRTELARYFIFLTVCWGIVLLGVFPGFFVYDAADELLEVITRQFTTHHPLLHVLYLGGVVQAGYKLFGDYNAGILLFSLLQTALFACGIVYMAARMHILGFGRQFCRIVIAFMGLFPVIPMCVLCSAKDSIFALVVLLWVLESYEVFRFPGKRIGARWILWSVLLCLLRHNALYALLVTGGVLAFISKERRKGVLVSLLVGVAAAEFVSFGLAGAFGAQASGHQELLTVPIQQLARTWQLAPETFSDAEKQKLYEYLPAPYLARYRDKLSDGVKIGFVNEAYEAAPAGFWRLWFTGLTRAPASYLDAWLLTSYGYWYPDTVIDVYAGNTVYTYTYGENAYFGYETEQPGARASLIPAIGNFYRRLSLEIYKEKLPVISLLFSPGFMLWGMLFCLGYLVKTRGFQGILPYMILVFMVATLLLGPTFLPRYVFFLWFCIPFMIGDIVYGCREKEPCADGGA